jgi:hypothetical protein
VVKNGVAAVVVCGNKRQGTLGLLEEGVISNIAPEAQTATWSIEERGRCEIYYQHPRNEEYCVVEKFSEVRQERFKYHSFGGCA